jgi:hypothetical protein
LRRWIAVAAGLFGLVAYVRRRRQHESRVEVEAADELRAKLAEKREAPAVPAEPEPAPEPPADPEAAAEPEAEPGPDAVGERRQDVHDRARAAIDELGKNAME